MDRETIIHRLQQAAPELRAAGIVHLRLFGSAARGTATAHSDVDILADFADISTLTLLDLSRLRNRLSTLVETEVDLSSPDWMTPSVRAAVLAEAVLAF